MTNADSTFRAVVTYAVVIPLAIITGVMLASQDPRFDLMTWLVVGGLVTLICVPLLFKWHHLLLFLFWNSFTILFILPGRPNVWLVLAFTSLGLALLQRALLTNTRFLPAPGVIAPMLFILLVVIVTAKARGGFGLSALGSTAVGSKRYIVIFGAIAGFLAMISRPVTLPRAKLYLDAYFLGNFLNAISVVAPILPSSMYFILLLFPVESYASLPGYADVGKAAAPVWRAYGVSSAFLAASLLVLARFGIRGLLEPRKRWRIALFLLCAVGSLVGGFRVLFVVLLLTGFFLLWIERLLFSRLAAGLLLAGILVAAVAIPLVDKLPLSIQRSLSVLPINVDPVVRSDAEGTSQWRIDMWKQLLPEIPKYLLLGKGLGIDARELESQTAFDERQFNPDATTFILSGDFHNGPLSTIIPFGIWGMIGLIWLLVAGVKALRLNLKYGDPALHTANALLLALFATRIVLFFFVFGGFYGDIATFTGLLGLSITLNGGVRKPAAVQARNPAPTKFRRPLRPADTFAR